MHIVITSLILQYATLLNALADSLEMKELPGVVGEQGTYAIHLVTNRIKLLKDRISRKEELLSGYENDLKKLRYDMLKLIIFFLLSRKVSEGLRLSTEILRHTMIL